MDQFTISAPSTARTVAEPLLALAPDGSAWVAWQTDDASGPEGGIRARRLDPNGSERTGEIVVARGSRGQFALGGLVALEGGGAVLAWRGEEGMAWVAEFDPAGHQRRLRFLEPCEGAPSLARNPHDDTLVIALVRTEGRGAVALRIDAEGEAHTLFEGGVGSDAVALCVGPRGFGLACRVERAVHVLDALGRSVITLPSPRMVPHALSLAPCGEQWACAFVGEDTGKLSMFVARTDGSVVRQADVWAPLTRPSASAPSLCASDDGLLIAWREERGPKPAVYLRPLDREAHRRAMELRVSTRGMVALAGRVGLASRADGGWCCAYAERREQGDGIFVAKS